MKARIASVGFALLLVGCTSRISGVVVNAAQVSDGRMVVRSCDLVQNTVFSFAWVIGFGSGGFHYENCRWSFAQVVKPGEADSGVAARASESP